MLVLKILFLVFVAYNWPYIFMIALAFYVLLYFWCRNARRADAKRDAEQRAGMAAQAASGQGAAQAGGKPMPAADAGMNAGAGTGVLAAAAVAGALATEGTKEEVREEAQPLVTGDDVEMMDGPFGRAPYGGVIWDDEYSIDEIIYKDGVYYYNENSEEWEEDDEDAF